MNRRFFRRGAPALLLLSLAACATHSASTNSPPPCTASQLKQQYEQDRSAMELQWDRRIAQATTALERERLTNQKGYELSRARLNFSSRYRIAVRADSLAGCKP